MLVEVVTRHRVIRGELDAPAGARLSDLVANAPRLRLSAAVVDGLAEHTVSRDEVTVRATAVVFVAEIAGAAAAPERRLDRVPKERVAVEVVAGSYILRGNAYSPAGADPVAQFLGGQGFRPLTEVEVRRLGEDAARTYAAIVLNVAEVEAVAVIRKAAGCGASRESDAWSAEAVAPRPSGSLP